MNSHIVTGRWINPDLKCFSCLANHIDRPNLVIFVGCEHE